MCGAGEDGEFRTAVYIEILQFLLVALSYQPPLNTSSRSYAVYEWTISTTYRYFGHNNSYLTINCLDHILLT